MEVEGCTRKKRTLSFCLHAYMYVLCAFVRESHEVYRIVSYAKARQGKSKQHKRMHVCAFCTNRGKQIYTSTNDKYDLVVI